MSSQQPTNRAALYAYLRDARFWVPALILLGFELFMQFGYRKLLDPQSYADNINRILGTVETSRLEPDLLVLGTSVAYQGINVRLLNDRLRPDGLTAQSGACQGAKLMTQHAIYRALKDRLPKLKYVVLVSEVSFPWTARQQIDEPNLSMIAQLPRRIAFGISGEYDMELTFDDRAYLLVRSITYRRDLRAFALRPGKRLKRLSRRYREPPSDYVYENEERFRISAYGASTLDECIANARRGVPRRDANGVPQTDRHHRNAVLQTCGVGKADPMAHPGGPQWTKLFFKRLEIFHREILQDGRVPITVFAPYSDLIRDLNADTRLRVWQENLQRIHGSQQYSLLDLRRSLDGPNNGDLYYDTIHLNRFGAERFTETLSRRLRAELGRIRTRQQQ